MASFCRSAIATGSRSIAARSELLAPRTLTPRAVPFPLSHSTTVIPRASRVLSALGSLESLKPLHSVIASARLRSSIAVDSSCWSWLSEGLATPL